MKDMKEKKTSFLWIIFLALFMMNMVLVLVISVLETENHLPASKMVILPVLFFVVLMVLYWFLYKAQNGIQKISSAALPVFLLVYGSVLFFIAVGGRNNPVHDQAAVYQGALYFAGLSENISWEYFARCNNNIIPAMILGVIFRIGALGGLVDPYYFAVLLNVVQVLAAMYCLFKMSKDRSGIAGAWITVFMLAACVPIVGHTLSLYTDSMSFCFGIVVLYLWQQNKNSEHKTIYWVRNFGIGILLGAAVLIKMTVLIPMIALCAYSIIQANKKMLGKSVAVLGVAMAVVLLGNYVTTLLPCEKMRDSYGTPKLSYWVGIGLKGNGGYIDNQEYSAQLNTIYGMEEKEAWSNQYINDNLYEFVNKDHIIRKLRYNFANGGLGCTIFVQNLNQDHWLYRMMHYDGDLYWRYSMLTTAYMYTLYGMIVIGMAANLMKKKPADAAFAVSLISILGIMLYLMLFEANNRQLYNHLPMFVLAASCGLIDIRNIRNKGIK